MTKKKTRSAPPPPPPKLVASPRYERLDAAVLSRGMPVGRKKGPIVFSDRQKLGMQRMEKIAVMSLEKTREFIGLMNRGELTEVEVEDRLLFLIHAGDELMKATIHQIARLYSIVENKRNAQQELA